MGPAPRFNRSFDVGPLGFSGYYDKMLSILQRVTPKVGLALALWAWVFTWTTPGAFVQVGPVLTLGLIFKLGLAAWSLWLTGPLCAAAWYWSRWRELEGMGLVTVLHNDHVLRVKSYDRKRDDPTLDFTTQRQRREQERAAKHARRASLAMALQGLAKQGAIFLVIAIGFALFTKLTGYSIDALTHPPDIAKWIAAEQSKGELGMARWLSRPDVNDLLGSTSVAGAILFGFFMLRVVPKLSDLFWVLYDAAAQAAGNQYVPGARVREELITEKTLDSLREQSTFGKANNSPIGEAARRMSE